MRLLETPIPGAFVVEMERLEDERGWFARAFDADAFREQGLDPAVIQCDVSFNHRAGTLRGIHYQAAPYGEPKFIRCIRGAIYDVIVDLREGSEAYCRWFAVELTPGNDKSLYVPPDVAHGFQSLTDHAEVHYQMGHEYVPTAARGVRWDDPLFGIEWPDAPAGRVISPKDRAFPDYIP